MMRMVMRLMMMMHENDENGKNNSDDRVYTYCPNDYDSKGNNDDVINYPMLIANHDDFAIVIMVGDNDANDVVVVN